MKNFEIGIIDYGAGNIGSLANMLNYLGYKSEIISKPEELKNFGKIILPGVGHFSSAMTKLNETGLTESIKDYVKAGNLFVGICLGFQLLTLHSEEGGMDGLGLVDAKTIKFSGINSLTQQNYSVPHMGWRAVNQYNEVAGELFLPQSRFYFVHSYHVQAPENSRFILSKSTYGGTEFISSIAQDNILGFQFHPEKSHKYGMHLLKNVLGQNGL